MKSNLHVPTLTAGSMKYIFKALDSFDLQSPALSQVVNFNKLILSVWDLIALLLLWLGNFKPLIQQNWAHTLQGLLYYLHLSSLFHIYCCNISLFCRKGLFFFLWEIHKMQAYFSYFTLFKSENPFHQHWSRRTIYLKILLRC